MPLLIVVVDVLVAERNAEHPLPNQRRYKVLDQFRAAAIDEALGETGQSARSPDPSLSTAAPPASDVIARHQTPPQRRDPRQPQTQTVQGHAGLRYTLSASGRSANRSKVVAAQPLSPIRHPDAYRIVRYPG
jgi:hypothetical protein